jgi:Zn-dependent protease/CBS domain-containing protein
MFGRRLTLFDLFGFKVRLDASWFLLAGLVAWSLAAGYFPYAAPGFDAVTYWVMGVVGVIGLALSVVVHELAHALVGRRHGMEIAGITLFVFGGIAEMNDEPATPRGEFRMAVAGPLMSVAIAGLSLGLNWLLLVVGGADGGNPAVQVLAYLGFLNLLLAGFNMIPAFPLDGGRVFRAALWAWRGDLLWATRLATRAGEMLGLGLMAIGVWQVVAGNLVAGGWWGIVGLFVRAAAAQAYRQQLVKTHRADHRIGRLMAEPVALAADMPAAAAGAIMLRRPHALYPVIDGDGFLLGCVEAGAVAVPAGSSRLIRDLMRSCGAVTIGENADAAQALARMQRCKSPRLMVTREGRLVGVVGLADLLPALSIRAEVAIGRPAVEYLNSAR